jgi:hypothetical protein
MWYLLVFVLAMLAPTRGFSQASQALKEKEKNAPVPRQFLPPAGMCRIWVDNVPAARQPAPTDCATAIRNKPPNARVVFPAEKGRGAAPKALVPKSDTTKKKPPKA